MRNAYVGEIVLWYQGGNTNETPIPAVVVETNTHQVRVEGIAPMSQKLRPGEWMRHKDDPYWNTVPASHRQRAGVYDWHPVYGPLFDSHQRKDIDPARRKEKVA